jgi:hypothetical protein
VRELGEIGSMSIITRLENIGSTLPPFVLVGT